MSSTSTPGATTVKHDMEGLAHQADVTAHDAGVRASDAVGALRDGASARRDRAGRTVDAAKKSLINAEEPVKRQVAEAEHQAASVLKSLRGRVTAHPLASIGVALGAGITAGILLSRSR